MQEILALIYIGLGYWAHCYLTKNKTYIHRVGQLFLYRLAIGTFFGFILIPVALLKLKFESMKSKKPVINNCNTSKIAEKSILVEIKGKVKKPNLYNINSGTRLYELIELAGGLTENANTSQLNRARTLIDGECIIIN